ncbi:hypothetical protein WR25_20280 isoform A [Diploscapter pachys]|uniref:B box-type domain-containing protein n=1 Tax=Diploscapter pachys TaxID=2018661 RepID=A0A2A2LP75_9BILA|nr:hypothetical protein WR25_20280 isoform A [Diploscapter pachys]
MDSGEETVDPRERVRQMVAQPPSSRPPEFVNPLEKIEQLLTCPICLDRYKTLKCPECRAEHNVPYEGVKAFQPNYTLTGFLEIHLQASADASAEIEDYIHRYNLERCKVCDEKADCEPCAHCDRKACKDCRTAHMDMLKRDMGRLLNQVRRLSNRIIEASDGVSKGIELLTLNCETTKDEVKEYFHRYQKEMKRREEYFINEIDMFHTTESRLMKNLRDVLEIESSNMSEAVARLDAVIKGECTMDDYEIVRLKNTFTDGVEYLRNFQPDADELFNRKVRFSAGEDAGKLPQAITTCGELCVLVPQFSGRYLPLEQSYLARPFRLPLESDHFRVPNGKTDDRMDKNSSRHGSRAEPDESSLRYRRRQALEEEAWNRIRGLSSSVAPEPHHSSRTSIPGQSPWSAKSENSSPERKKPVSSKNPESKMTNGATSPKKKDTLSIPTSGTSGSSSGTSPKVSPKSPVSPIKPADLEEKLLSSIAAASSKKPPLPRQASSNDDSLNEKVDNIRRAHAARTVSRQASESDEESDAEAGDVSPPRRTRLRIIRRSTSMNRDDAPQHSNTQPAHINPAMTTSLLEPQVAIPVTHYSGEDEELGGAPLGANALVDSSAAVPPDSPTIPPWLARRRAKFARSRTNPDLQSQFRSERVAQLLAERQERLSRQDSGNSESGSNGGHSQESHRIEERRTRLDSTLTDAERRLRARSASRASDGSDWRSRGRPKAIIGRKGGKDGELNWPRGVASLPGGFIACCDSSNHRVCVFDKEGRFVRAFGGYGSSKGQLDSAAGLATIKQRIIVSDRYNHRVCLFDLEGNFQSSFGGHGPGNGKFNNPWGVAVDDLGTIYVADKDNHRVQMFDKNGQFLGKFGAHGHLPGQLNCPLFVAVNKATHQVYVSDSSNHRISVYDGAGHHLFCFGEEGFQGGQLKFPRGVAVDAQGNVLVADSGNNRIQVFTSDGQFLSTFGTWGSGAGQLKAVEDLCVASDGSIIASDRENHRIQIF